MGFMEVFPPGSSSQEKIQIKQMVEIVPHGIMSESRLLEVIDIKSKAWDYPVEIQLEWMRNNLHSEDVHFMMYDELNVMVGYANIIDAEAVVNGMNALIKGVGNVCVLSRGKGDGLRLMNVINASIQQSGSLGMLFCKDRLVKFYEKAGWLVVRRSLIDCNRLADNVILMVYNSSVPIESLKYGDRLF